MDPGPRNPAPGSSGGVRVGGAGEGERPSQASCYRNGFKGERKLSIQPWRGLKPNSLLIIEYKQRNIWIIPIV
jgi:hypothetical protein